MQVDINNIYKSSSEVITRQIEEETIIVPLSSGIGDLNAELYSLNTTGTMVWEKLDGKTPLKQIISDLALQFNTPFGQIQKDIVELVEDLFDKALIKEAR